MYIVKKKINGKEYFYLNKAVRENGKVKSKNVAYLGKTREEAEIKAKEIIEKVKKGEVLKGREVTITYFVHGTTTDNKKGISTGQALGELSELGIKQSKELKEQIKDKKFDIVFCSDLKRAVDSANLTFKDSVKVIQDKRLRECNYGDLNQSKEDKVKYEEHIEKPFPNGESLKDVEKRIKDFLDYLYSNYKGKNIAIVSHKAPQLAIEVLLNKKSWEEALKSDWRKVGKWQSGWDYKVIESLKSEKTNEEAMNKETPKIEEKQIENRYDRFIELAAKKSIFYPAAEIYPNSPSGFWDFGPVGQAIRRKVVDFWRHELVQKENMLEIQGSQLLPAAELEG